jgi:hypothetical protein
MPRAGFEPSIPVLEWSKTVHGLDGALAVIGNDKQTYCRRKQGRHNDISKVNDKLIDEAANCSLAEQSVMIYRFSISRDISDWNNIRIK